MRRQAVRRALCGVALRTGGEAEYKILSKLLKKFAQYFKMILI